MLSVAVHVGIATLIVSLPRLMPKDPQPSEQGTVELLMVEQKGAQSGAAVQSKDVTLPPKPPEKPSPPKAEQQVDETPKPPSNSVPVPPAPEAGDEPVPPSSAQDKAKSTAETPPAPKTSAPDNANSEKAGPGKEATEQPAPPQSQKAPVFDLEGTDSESNATVLGERVLPAMKDDRFRNRPPIYPVEAEIHGEHGSVVVVIHVSENGLASGADVVESSGFNVLDQAVLTAVEKWHFRPAMREGRSVPFDMPFRFIFEP